MHGHEGYEPRIVGFLCNWCCYAGADLAGVSRFQYPPNIRVIRVMCSGRIEPQMILEAFARGADGVFVGGCHIGDCHYATGNLHTEVKIALTKRLLSPAGVDERRLRLEWVSAAEGARFAEVMREFTRELREMGPSETPGNLRAAAAAAGAFRLRSFAGKVVQLRDVGNVYGEKLPAGKLDGLLADLAGVEHLRHGILELSRARPMSCKDLAKRTGVEPAEVLRQIVVLRRKNLLAIEKIEEGTPLYRHASASAASGGPQ